MFILRKIIKIVATRCHILKAIMHKIRFLLDSAVDPAYSALADRRAAGATGARGNGKAEGRGGNLLLRRQEGGRKGKEGLTPKPKKLRPC